MSVITTGTVDGFRAGRSGFFGDNLPGNNSLPATGALNMNSYQINNLANGTTSTDAVNLSQLQQYLPLAGGTMTGTIDFGTNRLTNIQNAAASTDAVSLGQLNTINANKGYAVFTVSSATVADNAVVQYGNTASGNITQSGGVISIQNTASFTQGFVLYFQIFGVSAGNTTALYLQDGGGGGTPYAGMDTGVTSVASSHSASIAVQVGSGLTKTYRVLCRVSGAGTFTVSANGQGGLSMGNQFVVAQVY